MRLEVASASMSLVGFPGTSLRPSVTTLSRTHTTSPFRMVVSFSAECSERFTEEGHRAIENHF